MNDAFRMTNHETARRLRSPSSFVIRHSSFWFLVVALLSFTAVHAAETNAPARVIVVIGAAGEEEFGTAFAGWAETWTQAASKAGASVSLVGTTPDGTNDLSELETLLGAESKSSGQELWLVLLGHGTFAVNEAKFNLRGPDLSATNLAALLKPFTRPVAVLNCFSSSSPFLGALAANNRVVVPATRSGSEAN
jgi:hypothetical protein